MSSLTAAAASLLVAPEEKAIPEVGVPHAAAVAFVERELGDRGESHGLGHSLTVRTLALTIWRSGDFSATSALARSQGMDAERVVELSALLHDVCDHKYVDASTARGAAAIARRDAFLQEHASPAEAAACVAIIGEVSYSRENKALLRGAAPAWTELAEPVRTLRHVVSDADKIDAIGPAGLRRCKEYRLESDPDLDAAVCVRDVAIHCDEKLLRLLPEFIHTDAGKLIATPGHKFLADWRKRADVYVDVSPRGVTAQVAAPQ